MIVSINLAETFNAGDNAEQREIGNFARRLEAQLAAGGQYMPDVILLQEVNAESADTAADLISEYLYGDAGSTAFRVAVAPAAGESSVFGHGSSGVRLRRESAVLINTTTMKDGTGLSDERMYLALRDDQADMRHPEKWAWNHAATHRLVEEDDTGRVVVTSVHMVKSKTFKKFSRGTYKKGQWGKAIADLQAEMPTPTHVIAGDFNEDSTCEPQDEDAGLSACPMSPLWNQLTVQRSYQPAITPARKIDQVFVESDHLVAADWDRSYKDEVMAGAAAKKTFADCDDLWVAGNGREKASTVSPGCASQYYSDHAYTWALVAVAP
ncbi:MULTISPECIES: endonuclease/exonuclease/phosphatase family protein [unclassified Nocardioides]|uniref:endonuclease/exonuclease/phosphatase family protein n=1 Tax=unclassified Nocardioides TaxID=2615069 RepID=UPI0009F0EE5C|nr:MULTISPECIES: endonuclease/exonuclease/phosphatase family protein [unclassified Nocardioides]GAW50556.1 hypothetical protein PD653B2_2892 [Nocardioides sp. PD653-B2]GAW56680.1 hypothetical protein PD653_4118 [Nocardioides sp. PD653]